MTKLYECPIFELSLIENSNEKLFIVSQDMQVFYSQDKTEGTQLDRNTLRKLWKNVLSKYYSNNKLDVMTQKSIKLFENWSKTL